MIISKMISLEEYESWARKTKINQIKFINFCPCHCVKIPFIFPLSFDSIKAEVCSLQLEILAQHFPIKSSSFQSFFIMWQFSKYLSSADFVVHHQLPIVAIHLVIPFQAVVLN